MAIETRGAPPERSRVAPKKAPYRVRDSYLLHKLHSLTGIFPLGIFLAQHLIANSYSLRGPAEFNTVVKVFGYLPFVGLLEIGLIFLPLLFHGIYGLVIAAAARNNVDRYRYTRNWLYFFQRVTGVIAFAYITYHVWSTTVQYRFFGTELSYAFVAEHLARPWVLLFYIIGIVSVAYHFGNGLWNFLIRWGVTISERAQRQSAVACNLVGLVLAVIGVWTAVNFYVVGNREAGAIRRAEAPAATAPAPGRVQ